MRVKLQRIMCSDDGHADTITDIVTLQKDSQRIEHLGLTIREAKQLLNTIQKRLLQHQFDAFLDACATCPDCGTPLKAKGYHTRTFRTLFDTFKLASSRLFLCPCQRRKTTTFRPLTSPPSLPKSPFPRPSPQGTPEARPPILRRLSRPLCAALRRAAGRSGEADAARWAARAEV